MKTNEVLDTIVKGSALAMVSQVLTAQTAVKALVPKVDGEAAKIAVENAVLSLVQIGLRLLEAVHADADDGKLVEITAEFNETMVRLDKLLRELIEMSDVEYETKIPEERQKSLLSALEEAEHEDGVMAEYAKYHKQMLVRQAKTDAKTEIVEPIPGVLMLREKKFGNVPVPEVKWVET